MTRTRLIILTGFIGALILAALLRLAGFVESALTPYAGYSTLVYIGASVVAAVALARTGLGLDRFGFGIPFRLSHLGIALAGVAILQAWAAFGLPLVEGLMNAEPGAGSDRFSDIEGDVGALVSLLLVSWTVAAVGEEFSFRMVLMRGLKETLGGGAGPAVLALLVSAAVFGIIHMYKGPLGMVSSSVSGLVFGICVLAGRGAIWPAILCHGLNNTIGILRIYDGG